MIKNREWKEWQEWQEWQDSVANRLDSRYRREFCSTSPLKSITDVFKYKEESIEVCYEPYLSKYDDMTYYINNSYYLRNYCTFKPINI